MLQGRGGQCLVPLIIRIDALMRRPSEYWQARLAGCMHLHADTLSVVSHGGVGDLVSGHPVPEILVLYCVVQCSTVLYCTVVQVGWYVYFYKHIHHHTIQYCTVLGICNMVQGVGRHEMSSIVLLEGTGAYVGSKRVVWSI